MKIAKYKFGNEIQKWAVYTKNEFIKAFGLDIPLNMPHYFRDKAIKAFLAKNNNKMSEQEAVLTLKTALDAIKKTLPDRDYLHLEFLNVCDKLPDIQKFLDTLNNYQKIWKNVIEIYEK